MDVNINKVVQELMIALNLGLPVNFDRFFEYFPNLKIEYDVEESDFFEGKIVKRDNNYIVYMNKSKEQMNVRDRFTLAHELGHLFLGHVDEYEILYRRGANELEYAANEFAAELLMPRDPFIEVVNQNVDDDGRCDIDEVASFFQVSPSAALTRGKFLGLFSW